MDTDGDEYSSDEDDEEHERNVSRDVERSKKERWKNYEKHRWKFLIQNYKNII